MSGQKERFPYLEDSRRRVEQAGKDYHPGFYSWQLSGDRTHKLDGSDLPDLPHGQGCYCALCKPRATIRNPAITALPL
jgi:hypothetical protein